MQAQVMKRRKKDQGACEQAQILQQPREYFNKWSPATEADSKKKGDQIWAQSVGS